MSQRITKITLLALVILVSCLGALAQGKPRPTNKGSDIPVTSTLADLDASNTPYSVQSDGLGAYHNGVNSVTSILVANGYNRIVDGDWRLDMVSSTSRTVGITFDLTSAVQPGDPGYTAPANPPFWGTRLEAVRMENKCTMINHDMLTMKIGDKFTCPMGIRFQTDASSSYYHLVMAHSWTSLNEPETQDVQFACNSADSGGCNDWFIDPVPVVNADGSTSPGKARARLTVNGSCCSISPDDANEGDFYLTFHFHVTRP
jgi:hypothetical protein